MPIDMSPPRIKGTDLGGRSIPVLLPYLHIVKDGGVKKGFEPTF